MESTIFCPHCGAENKKSHQFCGSCGVILEQGIPSDKPLVDQPSSVSSPTPITTPSETQSSTFSGYQTSSSQQQYTPHQSATAYQRPVNPKLAKKATISLVLGIISLVASFIMWIVIVSYFMVPLLVLPIVGIILAVQANKQGAIGSATAGLITSIIGLLGQLGAFLMLLLLIVI